MKAGLLLCDHIPAKYHSIAVDYGEMFAAVYPNFDFEVYAVCDGEFPESVEDCEVYVCTGSHSSVYEEMDWIVRLKEFVREIHQANKKYIGHCFGHQMLAEALGGKVERSKIGWCVGVHTFEVVKQENWMKPFQESFNIIMLCQDQVQILPPNSTVLATSKDCPIAMFRVGDNMLGIQGHPEFPKNYERGLIEDRKERIGMEKAKSAIESLQMNIEGGLFVGWVERFLTHSGILNAKLERR